MTRRKPLGWLDTEWGRIPDCSTCIDYMAQPWMAEAVASVAIEHPTTPGALMRRTVDTYHANRHREAP